MRAIVVSLFLFFLFLPLVLVDSSISKHIDSDQLSKNVSDNHVSLLNILKSDKIKSKAEIFSYYIPGRIKLTVKEMAAFKNWYKQRYKDNEWLGRRFKKAYYDMGAWDEKIKKIFRDEFSDTDIPTEFAELLRFIAIPESHWDIITSSAGAYGYYQIMPKTGKNWGMNIGRFKDDKKNIDERRDPLVSARICAKYLKKYYLRYNNIYLAINTWNGSYPGRHFSLNNNANLESFAQYMEDIANAVREDTERVRSYDFYAPAHFTLKRVAEKFKVDVFILRANNNFSDMYSIKRKFRRKTIINIIVPRDPIKAVITRAAIFKQRTRGIQENFTFLAKVIATIELINEGFVNKLNRAKPYKFIGTLIVEQTSAGDIYIVQKGDNVWSVARKFPGVSPKEIKDRNYLDKSYKIYPGQELIIPDKSGPAVTLMSIAKILEKDQEYINKLKINIDLKKTTVFKYLKKINPAIINIKLPLPNGYKIRI